MGNLGLSKGSYGTKKGRYVPKNPGKYLGDPTRIFYRSGWEEQVMAWADRSSWVERWGSETVEIPYRSPVDGRVHRYYVDFAFEIRLANRTLLHLIVELKPSNQLKAPVKAIREGARTKSGRNQLLSYLKNRAKFDAARAWAARRKMRFEVWTEKTMKQKGII